MDQFLQLSVNGLALGSIYALVALGFVMVYQATSIVNFATGQLVMFGSFMAVATLVQAGLPVVPGYLLALLGMALLGLVFHGAVYHPLRDRPILTVIIGTVAIGIVIQNGALLTWGSWPLRVPSPFGEQLVTISNTVISVHMLFTIAVTALLVLGLYLLLFRTAIGTQMRAVAQDAETARLMGISANRLIALTWCMAAVLGGVAGLLLGPMWLADVNVGDPIAVKAFAAAIIGGFGSAPGAILGGIFIGLAEILGASYISAAYKDGFAFVLMTAFLLVRPQGIFGEKTGERG